MLTRSYIEALLVDEWLADQVPGLRGDCGKAGEAAGAIIRSGSGLYLGFSCYENKRGTSASPPKAAVRLVGW